MLCTGKRHIAVDAGIFSARHSTGSLGTDICAGMSFTFPHNPSTACLVTAGITSFVNCSAPRGETTKSAYHFRNRLADYRANDETSVFLRGLIKNNYSCIF